MNASVQLNLPAKPCWNPGSPTDPQLTYTDIIPVFCFATASILTRVIPATKDTRGQRGSALSEMCTGGVTDYKNPNPEPKLINQIDQTLLEGEIE